MLKFHGPNLGLCHDSVRHEAAGVAGAQMVLLSAEAFFASSVRVGRLRRRACCSVVQGLTVYSPFEFGASVLQSARASLSLSLSLSLAVPSTRVQALGRSSHPLEGALTQMLFRGLSMSALKVMRGMLCA